MPAGGNSRFRGYPARMSERQQLALLLQMTSQEMVSGTDVAGTTGLPDESTTTTLDKPCSPSETSTTVATTAAAPSSEQEEQQPLYQYHNQYQQQQQQRAVGNIAAAASHVAEDSGASYEMRRTPPQNKVDRSGTGQSGSSPKVTLRLNQVRGARDEKKGASNSRQGSMSTQTINIEVEPVPSNDNSPEIDLNLNKLKFTRNTNKSRMEDESLDSLQSQGSMETSSKTPVNTSSVSTNAASGTSTSGNASSTDSGDIYEFKSSKEPTPVRGASSSPNPDKDKDGGKSSNGQNNHGGDNNASGSSISINEAITTPLTTDEVSTASMSPTAKRNFEGDNVEEQDEEVRRKKRKDSENTKETAKANTLGRQNINRNAVGGGEKCVKLAKQGSGMTSSKGSQNTSSINADRKSPSTSSMASSPKPSNTSSSTSAKTGIPALESDGEEDRSKCSDSNIAPKVPPLKIVIPQSTTSEQEQGNRNGKNIANRSHQLPYVVASSNSNDSTDKEQNQSASGTTSPTESTTNTKGEEKKDFAAALHSEERSTHHQRVLRSSHRTGNGNNGSTTSKETTPSSGNGNYSNSSPLPINTSMDRSNNSSPQQRHHSPTPEIIGSDVSKATSSESTNAGTIPKSNTTVEKLDKNIDASGKNQKDNGTENLESISVTTSSTMSNVSTPTPPVELHPRKRKMKPNKEAQQTTTTVAASEAAEAINTGPEIHPHDQPITNCYQLFLNIRKQIERRRKSLFPVQPKPPQGFKDYLMNRCTYVLASNAKEPNVNPPAGLHGPMKDLYIEQEKERYRLRMQHVVEKEKLVLSVEQEILRVHGRAARALANQSLPFSVCTILKDEEVYNVITPEQEEKDRNARSRYNGRLFLSWLQDVDDKWEKIKEGMLLRHHNEAESLHAVQQMHWEWKLKEVGLCESKITPQIEDVHVPMVHVSDDFDLLPA